MLKGGTNYIEIVKKKEMESMDIVENCDNMETIENIQKFIS